MDRFYQVGDRVELIADADYSPYTIARKGERGAVVEVDDSLIDIRLDKKHAGLDAYGNCIWLTPDLASLVHVKKVSKFPQHARRVLRAAVIAALIVFTPAPWSWVQAAHCIQQLVEDFAP